MFYMTKVGTVVALSVCVSALVLAAEVRPQDSWSFDIEAGAPRPSLVIIDLDGDAALAIPESDGSLVISEVRKLSLADGGNIRLCGINGLWGRGHLELVDWDGDGRPDLLVSAENGKVYAFRHDEISPGPEVLKKKGN